MKSYIKKNGVRFPYHILREIKEYKSHLNSYIYMAYCKSYRGYEYFRGDPKAAFKSFDEFKQEDVPSDQMICRNCIQAYQKTHP